MLSTIDYIDYQHITLPDTDSRDEYVHKETII